MRSALFALLIGTAVMASNAGAIGDSTVALTPAECEEHLKKFANTHEGKANDVATQWAMYLLELQRNYHNHLANQGAFADPFKFDLTLEDAQKKFDGLSYIVEPNDPLRRKVSILGKAREFIVKTPQITLENALPLLKDISAYSQTTLKDQNSSNANLYRGSVALDLLLPALMPALPPVELPPEPGEEPSQPQKKKADKQQEKKQEMGKKAPPEYPDEMDQYEAHTKDTDQESGGGEQEPLIISEINEANIPYFVKDWFSEITLINGEIVFRKAPLPGWKRPLADAGPTHRRLKINLGTRTEGVIVMPLGFEPMQMEKTKSGKVTLQANGSYHISGSSAQTEIGVVKESLQLGPLQMEFLRRPVGIKKEAWPDDIRIHLLDHLKGLDAISAAKKVETYLRNEYLYSVGPKPEKNPIAVLKAIDPDTGKAAFQCDMAAGIMTAIMKDFVGVPCMVGGVFRGSKPAADTKVSHVKLPTEGHAIVRCFDSSGYPHDFDPTPKNKDKKKKNEDQKDESELTINKEFEDDKPEASEAEGGKPDADGKGTDHKSILDENSKKRLEQTKGKDGEKTDEKGQRDKSTGDAQPEGKDERDPETSEALELGTLSLKPNGRGDMLSTRTRHLYLRTILNPGTDAYTSLQSLNRFKQDPAYDSNILSLINRAEKGLMQGRQRGVGEAIMALAGTIKQKDLMESFKTLLQVEDRIDLYADLVDPGDGFNLKQLVAELRRIKEYFKALNDAGRIQTGMAEKFYATLPMHAKKIVGEKYGISAIGQNIETQNMMKGITSGELRDFNIMRTLYPMTDFIMDSVRAPTTREIQLQMHDRRYFTGAEFLPVTDAQDIPRGFSLQPELDAYQNFAQGTLILPGRRQRVMVPNPGGFTQPYRVTIALYDTSGSMDGIQGDFQAALLATFVDRALADRTRSGQHRHKCLVAGFDDNVHSEKIILNSAQAENVIRNYRKEMKNTNKGTNIQNALVEAVNQIVAAEKEAGEPLASANILLLSDGGATVDAEFMKKQFARVNRKTPIKLMFIAINGTNQALIELTRNALEAGAAEAYYKEFTTEHIAQLMKEGSEAPQVNLDRELYTAKTAANLPKNLDSILGSFGRRLSDEIHRLDLLYTPRPLIHWEHEMSLSPILHDTDEPTPIKSEMQRVRSLFHRSKVLKERGFPAILVNDVMTNFNRTFGKPWTPLMVKEREQINHFISEAIRAGKG